MPVYLCRWENGDFSVVQAKNKMDAIQLLDEVGGASERNLTALRDFMVHFSLKDDGEFELEGFGEMTDSYIEEAYPALFDESVYTEDGRDPALMREAAKKEKARLWPKNNAKTPDRSLEEDDNKNIDKEPGKTRPN
jgi:hypothetical protein